MKYTIDAKGKKLGRVASEAAALLLGKNTTTFARNTIADADVEILNASQADIDEKKLTTTLYARYSGYPGGLRKPNMQNVIDKKGYSEIFSIAVYGMLPTNKLRSKIIKHLTVKE